MEVSDLLLTAAEVSIALAGFASVVSIFGQRYANVDPRIGYHRLRTMVELSLTATAFSLVPLGLAATELSEVAAWRISSLMFVAVGAPHMIYRYVRLRGSASSPDQSRFNLTTWIWVGVGVVAQIGLLLVAFGALPGREVTAYLFALSYQLGIAGLYFLRLLESFRPRDGGSSA
jgi:Na+/proline symporter